jgi:uncharacterized protein (TIGR03084 family)
MSVRSFATARLMETWAHGQDVWDVVRGKRPATARLKQVAHLGVTTFGWTFVNRGLPIPSAAPYVELAAPVGGNWSWGNPGATDFVRCIAEDVRVVRLQQPRSASTSQQPDTRPADWRPVSSWHGMRR